MATFVSGIHGDFYFNATQVKCKNWEFSGKANAIDVTTKANNGFKVWIAGLREGELTATIPFDDTIHSGNPPLIFDGASGTFSLYLYDGTSGESINGSCLVTDVKVKHDLDGALMLDVTAKASGQYKYAGETTS